MDSLHEIAILGDSFKDDKHRQTGPLPHQKQRLNGQERGDSSNSSRSDAERVAFGRSLWTKRLPQLENEVS